MVVGLEIEGDIGEATGADEVPTIYEEHATACLRAIRQGHAVAALAAARELCREIILVNNL